MPVKALKAVALILLVAASYLPALQGGYVWDDDYYVTDNAVLRSAEGLARIWLEPTSTPQYYPMVFTSFWVEYQAWGLGPLGYHAVNILLHGLNSVLLWTVLQALGLPGAWFAAAVFGVHPVQVESVAWIAERKNVLSGLFFLLAIRSYLRFSTGLGDAQARQPSSLPGTSRDWKHYACTLLYYVLALFSKTVTATMPAAVLLLLWWKKSTRMKRELVYLSPFFILGVGSGITTAWLEYSHVGARGGAWDLSVLDRMLVAGRSTWFYLQKMVWPGSLTFNYPRWDLDAVSVGDFLFPLSAAGVLVALWLYRRRLGRGPCAAAAFFIGTLSPALGFLNVFPMRYSFVADHFVYLAIIGPTCLLVGLVAGSSLPARYGQSTGIVVIAIFSALTWRQGALYEDEETLWQDTLKKNPTSWMANNNLGVLRIKHQSLAEAIPYLERSIEIDPRQPESFYNLGLVQVRLKNLEKAIGLFEKAIRIDPAYAEAYNNLGGVWYMKGDVPIALEYFRKSVALKPGNAQAQNNLGLALMAVGRPDEAVAHFQAALRIQRDYPEAQNNLNRALASSEGGRRRRQGYQRSAS